MTPEERLKAIENLLAASTENQVRHEAQIDQHQKGIEKHSAQFEEQRSAIHDLIVVGRTVLNSILEMRVEIRESQKVRNEKLSTLIEKVDLIIRSQQQ